MNASNPIAVRLFALVSYAAVAACGDYAEPGAARRAPTPLMDGFASYLSVAEAKARVPEGLAWTVREDSKSPPRGLCPRDDRLFVSIYNWQHAGFMGELSLGFVNGVLYATLFYPDGDFAAYLSWLTSTGTHFTKPDGDYKHSAHRAPRTRIWHITDGYGRNYVGWEDEALVQEILDGCVSGLPNKAMQLAGRRIEPVVSWAASGRCVVGSRAAGS